MGIVVLMMDNNTMFFRNYSALPLIGIPMLIAAFFLLGRGSYSVITALFSMLLIGFGYIAAYIDFKIRKVPNKLVLAMLVCWVVIMSVYVFVDITSATQLLTQSLIGGLAAGVFFLFIYLISRKGLGGGDVKLVAVMGLYLTFAQLMPMLFFSSILAALVSGILLLTKRATMKSSIPLVPFLYIGVLATIFL